MADNSNSVVYISNDNHQHMMAENILFESDFLPRSATTFGSVNLRAVKRYILLPMEWMFILGFLMLFLNSGKDTAGFISGLTLFTTPLLIFCAVLATITVALSFFTLIATGSTEC
jgi:hypothetical protein